MTNKIALSKIVKVAISDNAHKTRFKDYYCVSNVSPHASLLLSF